MKEKNIWQPITLTEKWLNSDTFIFDEIAVSWKSHREKLQQQKSQEYKNFIEQLKREHAIETGIVENLYDLDRGVTETLIQNGFMENYLSHNDGTLPPKKLFKYFDAHFDGIDFVFDLIKTDRGLSISFIKELHQLILKAQDFTEAIEQGTGKIIEVKIIKGEFKKTPNNPKRKDGILYTYCPPEQVDIEMENLLKIYDENKEGLHPIILATWFHHAFTQIHPFQDGNGRMARLLSTLILIQNNLFPFNLLRDKKNEYLDALEKADSQQPQELIDFFCQNQRKKIEKTLNLRAETQSNSLEEITDLFANKIENFFNKKEQQTEGKIENNRNHLFEKVGKIVNNIKEGLYSKIPKDKCEVFVESVSPKDNKYYYYEKQIIEYAKENEYFFNKQLSRGWFKISFCFKEEKKYQKKHQKRNDKRHQYNIIISIHHYGYSDDIVAIAVFLEKIDKRKKEREQQIREQILFPKEIEPYILSLNKKTEEKSEEKIRIYLENMIAVGMGKILENFN